MIKKITVDQLKPGMFIQDINCGWLDHPFLSNSMKVGDEQLINKIRDYGIREIYIDTDNGYDVGDAPTEDEVKQGIQTEIDRIIEPEKISRAAVPIHEEILRAREIKNRAKETVKDIMEDMRFGKQIKTEKAAQVVDEMIDSIFRNQDAL